MRLDIIIELLEVEPPKDRCVDENPVLQEPDYETGRGKYFRRSLDLPFAPYPDLRISLAVDEDQGADVELGDLYWSEPQRCFISSHIYRVAGIKFAQANRFWCPLGFAQLTLGEFVEAKHPGGPLSTRNVIQPPYPDLQEVFMVFKELPAEGSGNFVVVEDAAGAIVDVACVEGAHGHWRLGPLFVKKEVI